MYVITSVHEPKNHCTFTKLLLPSLHTSVRLICSRVPLYIEERTGLKEKKEG